VEFAISLPLLAVFIVGIFDFGEAFNVKQKLNNAAREGAHLGSSLPTHDLSVSGTPPSVSALRDLVDAYLQAGKMNECGLSTQSAVNATPLTWVFSASGNGCPGTLTLTVQRGYAVPTNIGLTTINVICTRIEITYPYQWHFNSIIQLLVPGASYSGTTLIATDAVSPNMD
jgi:Flp pilus assembly protein TadG